MKPERIIQLIEDPKKIKSDDIITLNNLLLKYPYFHIGQLLLTKGLLNTKNIHYNRQLKKAAAYCLDRKKLFYLITLNEVTKNKTKISKKEKTIEKKLAIGEPLEFNKEESHSFSEWLTLLNVKKIQRKEPDLIDDFLSKEITITKPKKEAFFKPTDIAKESLIANDDLVTPTLAKVYLEQGHYEKAIDSYKKLILKYPKKSSFFAAQIKLIDKLNKK